MTENLIEKGFCIATLQLFIVLLDRKSGAAQAASAPMALLQWSAVLLALPQSKEANRFASPVVGGHGCSSQLVMRSK